MPRLLEELALAQADGTYTRDFEWNWPTKIDGPLVESLLSVELVDAHRNVVLVAPGGLGKTMIAQNVTIPRATRRLHYRDRSNVPSALSAPRAGREE